MIRKIYLQSLLFFSVFLMIITGATVYAHGPGVGSGSGNFMGNNSYGMMGGHGMMGGGSMGGFDRGYGNGFRSTPRDYDHKESDRREEIASLRKEIDKKRMELAALYRSNVSDKSLIEKKIAELENLERYFDEKTSFYGSGR